MEAMAEAAETTAAPRAQPKHSGYTCDEMRKARGRLTAWLSAKQYGFVSVEGTEHKFFLHRDVVVKQDQSLLVQGLWIEFSVKRQFVPEDKAAPRIHYAKIIRER